MGLTMVDVERRGRGWPTSAVNVGPVERWASIGAGLALLAAGVRRKSVTGAALALTGASLLYRGASRSWGVYAALERQRRLSAILPRSVADEDGVPICATIRINRPARDVYRFWRKLENLPRVFSRLESVTELDDRRSHWVLRMRAGELVEWDTVITDDVPDKLIAWRAVDGAPVATTGSVTFTRVPGSRTDVTLTLRYAPSGGDLPEALARWLGHAPADQIRTDLKELKIELEADDEM